MHCQAHPKLVIQIKYIEGERLKAQPFSSIFSKAARALLVFTFPSISLTLVAVLQTCKTDIYPSRDQTI